MSLRIAEVSGHIGLEDGVVNGLQEATLLGEAQAAGIGGDDHIGRAVGAFGLHAAQQFIIIGHHHVHLDARGPREVGEELLVRFIMAVGVHVHHLLILHRGVLAGHQPEWQQPEHLFQHGAKVGLVAL